MKKIEKNRTHYRTIALRCSDSELEKINKRIELSGLRKQDYLIKSVMHRQITVIGNRLLFEKLEQVLVETKQLIREGLTKPRDVSVSLGLVEEYLEGMK